MCFIEFIHLLHKLYGLVHIGKLVCYQKKGIRNIACQVGAFYASVRDKMGAM